MGKNFLQKRIKNSIVFHQLLLSRYMSGQRVQLFIYSSEEMCRDHSKIHVKITPFLIDANAPTVIVCPGGAYKFISRIGEGITIAQELNKKGYNAILLNYSIGKHARYPAPMNDLAKCITYIKNNADAMNINAENIHLMGFSAGGHLCAYFGARYKLFEENISLRPKTITLAYPVISMGEDTHSISKHSLLGIKPTDFEIADKSVENIVDENYPPVFFMHCKDDHSVPVSNSLRFDAALTEKGVKHEMKLYDNGGHGVGLGEDTDAVGWLDSAVEFIDSVS